MSATSKPIKIKEVIDTFCLLFRCHGYSKISAEILRQSKFNQRVVVIPLLDFVFNVLTKNLDHDLNSWNSSKKFMLVLSTLKEIDYPRTHLLFCKELIDMSSQELLLAFGYLLVKLDIIGKLSPATVKLRFLETILSLVIISGRVISTMGFFIDVKALAW